MTSRAYLKAFPAVILALVLVTGTQPAAAQDPVPAPGTDPGGPAIALISTGVDYTDPMIAARLARDGEGEPIAWDFVESDLRPHAPADPEKFNGTRLAKLILSLNDKARLINVRVSPDEPDQLAKAAMFVARTPARVAVVGTYPKDVAGWEQFGGAARHAAARVLFVVPGDAAGQDVSSVSYPFQLNLKNAITAAPRFETNGAPNDGNPDDGNKNLPVDARIMQREIKIGEETLAVPTNSLEAAALLGAYAVCVIDDKDIEEAAAARAFLEARAIEDAAAKNVYDPNCAEANGGNQAPAEAPALGSGEK
jgi:hypothetical protein